MIVRVRVSEDVTDYLKLSRGSSVVSCLCGADTRYSPSSPKARRHYGPSGPEAGKVLMERAAGPSTLACWGGAGERGRRVVGRIVEIGVSVFSRVFFRRLFPKIRRFFCTNRLAAGRSFKTQGGLHWRELAKKN